MAQVQFLRTGELPTNELQRECVLMNVALDLLWAHKRGRDVTEAMAVFVELDRCEGEERKLVLQRLCEMAASGRLREPIRGRAKRAAADAQVE
jgi:hypothetical protein